MDGLLRFIYTVLDFYIWILIATAVMSWLITFDVVNIRNRAIRAIWDSLLAVTEPVLMPIRRRLPRTGGLDLSPIIVIFGIYFIQMVILPALARSI
jgi:YggT family protein